MTLPRDRMGCLCCAHMNGLLQTSGAAVVKWIPWLPFGSGHRVIWDNGSLSLGRAFPLFSNQLKQNYSPLGARPYVWFESDELSQRKDGAVQQLVQQPLLARILDLIEIPLRLPWFHWIYHWFQLSLNQGIRYCLEILLS